MAVSLLVFFLHSCAVCLGILDPKKAQRSEIFSPILGEGVTVTPCLKTYMTGWKIPIFNRKYIFKWSIFQCHLSFQWCISSWESQISMTGRILVVTRDWLIDWVIRLN